MKILLPFSILFTIVLHVYCADRQLISRSKRAAYDLTDGWYLLINAVNPAFNCMADGYYADIANGCQLYHVCQFLNNPYSKPRFLQYTFICGNGTIFNQLTMTCTHPQESIPCESSADFFYLNDRIGEPKSNFLGNDDFARAEPLMRTSAKRARVEPTPRLEPKPKLESTIKLESPANQLKASNLLKPGKPITLLNDDEDGDNSLEDDFS